MLRVTGDAVKLALAILSTVTLLGCSQQDHRLPTGPASVIPTYRNHQHLRSQGTSTMTKIADTLLPEFDQEMAMTRRVIERVPDDNPDWKPHPKSFSMAHLAQLLSWLPGWIGQTLTSTELDLASGGGYSVASRAALLETFDENVRKSREAIAAAKDSDYDVPWSLKMKGNVLFTLPRRAVVRQHISHLSHHRGQMTVYLRLRDVPVPSIYGPTADEGWGG
jgi:uncharacterized damage-inducible protein DinB